MHFGFYLKNKGIITAEQLVDALEVQLNSRVPIGQLALEEGLLAARHIFDILRAHSDSPSERFGDLAVEMGLLTRDDVMRLLMIQADRMRAIEDILVRRGALTAEQAAAELAKFRQSVINPQRATWALKVVPAPRAHSAARATAETVAAV